MSSLFHNISRTQHETNRKKSLSPTPCKPSVKRSNRRKINTIIIHIASHSES
jgi:hypothetical protein